MSRLIRTDQSKNKRPQAENRDALPLTNDKIIDHLKACQNIAVELGRSAFMKYLPELDEAFSVEIDNARSNQEVSEISGLQRLFRRNRDELERYYCGYIGEGFVKFKKKELHTVLEHAGDSNELTLVDNDELEETIAISTMTQKMDVYYAESIWALNQRFAILNGGEQVTEATNPATPIQFCESLRRALRLIPLTQRAKATAYQSYEKTLNDLVKAVLADTNEYLRAVGVLPNLKYSPPRSSAKKPEEPAPAAPTQASGVAAGAQAISFVTGQAPDPRQPTGQYQASLIHAIRNLQQSMSGQRAHFGTPAQASVRGEGHQGQGNAFAGGGFAMPFGQAWGSAASFLGGQPGVGTGPGVVISGDQLLAALQGLQASNVDALGASTAQAPVSSGAINLSPLDFQSVLQGLASQIQTKTQDRNARVADNDMHTIDLVGLVFEYMLSDENLPVRVKALLSYLHTPFLKLAFIDPGFFEQSDHPARMLLNNLADAGSRWVGNDGTDQYEMYSKIKSVVDQVLTDFKNDVRVITEILLDFNSYTKNIVRRQELMERRATEKVQGEERLREVKIRVNEEVMNRTDGKELPSAVLLFLLQPWSDFLSFTLLRYGEDSGKWQSALALVDDLTWAIEPKEAEVDQVRQESMLNALEGEILGGFETIGYDQAKGNQLIETITSLIRMALNRQKAEPASVPMRSQLEKIAEEKAGKLPNIAVDFSEEEQKMVERLRMVEFGTWFEFEDGKRLKVAWFNARTSNYMMVDQMGKKVDMMSGLDLARAMLNKRAKIIAGSSKPFFERALENIFQKLNAAAEDQQGDNNNDN